jgi:hypothetical protein
MIWRFHHPITLSPRHLVTLSSCTALVLLLAGCAGGRPTATPLPPDVARPMQPTPVYANATVFSLASPPPAIVATPAAEPLPGFPGDGGEHVAAATPLASVLWPQPPSALGIVRGGASLLARPGGNALSSLPAGAVVTVTGKTVDGQFVAAYTDDGIAGWISAGQLTLLGADDLVVVEESAGPGPIATLLAEAMQPVTVQETLVATPAQK